MNIFGDQSMASALLAASGGDTVKLFDVSGKPGDPCVLSYTPSPGSHVNSLKWNHTNLVVASAGDDRKISLWRKNGQSLGTIPVSGTDTGDNIDESIMAISFSNKVSRYVCTGGTGQVVRIWDLQRKRCIKWLKGHTGTITGAMYNCKDEHLASISLSGDLILHNLASGARTTELKDPNQQILRVLDYSRISRHLLLTAGDDGTIHLWDTTGRCPKVSWLKQHSAPTAGIGFSPSSDKTIASIGLDKKLYTYDSGSRRPSTCISYEAPFSSLAYRDDGWVLAAGTSTGRVVFYDVRGKPEPVTVLRAYNSSEAVTSLCWQRSKPVVVNESICSAETALLGDSVEDSILMPDPLPSVLHVTPVEETPQPTHLRSGGPLPRLHHPARSSYNFKDEMDVFSPIVDVHPITPGLDRFTDDHDRLRKEKPSLLPYPPSTRRYPFTKDAGGIDPPMFDWKSTSIPEQDDGKPSPFGLLGGSTPSPLSKIDDTSITPPEAWGGEKLSDKYTHIRTLQSRSGSTLAGVPDFPATSSQTSSSFGYANLRTKDSSLNPETSFGLSENFSLTSPGTKGVGVNLESPGSLTRRFSTYAERISTTSAFSDTTLSSLGSPKIKKTGSEPKEIFHSLLSKSDTSSAVEIGGLLPMINGGASQSSSHKAASQQEMPQQQQGNTFTLQLFQRALEETLHTIQKSVRDDIRNLHIELLRQFHLQEMENAKVQDVMLENLDELRKEVKALREENHQLRQLL